MTKTNLFNNLNKIHVFWAVLLLIPALYINLDLLPLIGDEAIRAVVAMEMMLSGDFITPTLNGELYFNKPPLFNWILTGFFSLTGRNDEFMVRLPTTLFLIVYGLTIFIWVKRYISRDVGMLSALFFITCGRVLFWDSFLGLIDITYSWLLFLNFMLIWHFYVKQSFPALFLVSYAICAVTFLLKGLPSLVFQGITLIALFTYKRNFRLLFNKYHFAGIILFLVITGSYYLVYHMQNPGYLDQVLIRLLKESTQKSALGTGIEKTIIHLFSFPFEVLYHFVPWTILVIFLFHKGIARKVFSNDFVRYCIIIFLSNIIVYWLSPITYPRYLLMLIPLLFIVLIYAGQLHQIEYTINFRIVKSIIIILMAGFALASVILPLIFKYTILVKHLYLKVLILIIILTLILYAYFFNQKKGPLLYYFLLIVIVSRISFDLFLVPYRQSISWMDKCRSDAIKLGQGTKEQDLFVMTDTITIPSVYYITRERNEILTFKDTPDINSYFIVDKADSTGYTFRPEFGMRIPYYRRTYYAGKFVIL